MSRIITLDFETYYDKDYSLSKMSTESYIRDPRFEVIGVSVMLDHNKPVFYRGAQAEEVLNSLQLDAVGTQVISHNARFDMGILAFRFGIYPYRMVDTMAMAMVSGLSLCAGGSSLDILSRYGREQLQWWVPAKGNEVHNMIGIRASDMTDAQWKSYGDYCVDDASISYILWNNMRDQVPEDEMYLIHITLEMFTKPVFALDVPLLREYAVKLVKDREDILVGLSAAWGIQGANKGKVWQTPSEVLRGMLRSGDKFAKFLEALGVEPPKKRASKTATNPSATNPDGTPKMAWAFAKTDLRFKEIMEEHEDPRVRAICEARVETYGSLADSRTQRFIEVGERGGLLPIPLLYGGAHTLRYGGADKINIQNLPSRGGDNTLRSSIISPPGYVIIGADSSQIEARLNAYIAQEQGLLTVFENGADPYSYMAAGIYGVPYERVYHEAKVEPTKEGKIRRMVGKETVLACGYQMSGDKFELRLKQQGILLPDGEPQRIVSVYRNVNARIKNNWYAAQDMLKLMAGGGSGYFGGPNGNLFYCNGADNVFGTRMATVRMPNGTYLRYRNLRIINDDETGKEALVYDKLMGRGYARTYIYGGKFIENCIAEDTLVLTKRGWKPIQCITRTDWVHDGSIWVQHGGTVLRSVQECVTIDGVYMTPDHKVLDETQTWKAASEQPRPYRPNLRGVDVLTAFPLHREKMGLGIPVPVWERVCETIRRRGKGIASWRAPELRVYDKTTAIKTQNARHVKASCLRRVAEYVSAVFTENASRMEELRWAWNNRLRRMGELVRGFLGLHGRALPARYGSGPDRQQRGVYPRKLSLGNTEAEFAKQTEQHRSRHSTIEPTIGSTEQHDTLSPRTGPRYFRVYDILNCGPKTRFVVKGDNGPMIVHNCTQALAFAILKEQAVRMANQGVPIKLNVHDEWVTCVPMKHAAAVVKIFAHEMRRAPDWCKGMPLDCEIDIGTSYGKSKTLEGV